MSEVPLKDVSAYTRCEIDVPVFITSHLYLSSIKRMNRVLGNVVMDREDTLDSVLIRACDKINWYKGDDKKSFTFDMPVYKLNDQTKSLELKEKFTFYITRGNLDYDNNSSAYTICDLGYFPLDFTQNCC